MHFVSALLVCVTFVSDTWWSFVELLPEFNFHFAPTIEAGPIPTYSATTLPPVNSSFTPHAIASIPSTSSTKFTFTLEITEAAPTASAQLERGLVVYTPPSAVEVGSAWLIFSVLGAVTLFALLLAGLVAVYRSRRPRSTKLHFHRCDDLVDPVNRLALTRCNFDCDKWSTDATTADKYIRAGRKRYFHRTLISSLQRTLAATEARLAQEKSDHNASKQTICIATGLADAAQEKLNELKKKQRVTTHSKLPGTLRKLQELKEQSGPSPQELQLQNQALAGKQANLEAKVSELQTILQWFQAETSGYSPQAADDVVSTIHLVQAVRTLEIGNEALMNNIHALTGENHALRSEYNAAKTQYENERTRSDEAEKSKQEALNAVSELRAQLSKRDAEIASLKTELGNERSHAAKDNAFDERAELERIFDEADSERPETPSTGASDSVSETSISEGQNDALSDISNEPGSQRSNNTTSKPEPTSPGGNDPKLSLSNLQTTPNSTPDTGRNLFGERTSSTTTSSDDSLESGQATQSSSSTSGTDDNATSGQPSSVEDDGVGREEDRPVPASKEVMASRRVMQPKSQKKGPNPVLQPAPPPALPAPSPSLSHGLLPTAVSNQMRPAGHNFNAAPSSFNFTREKKKKKATGAKKPGNTAAQTSPVQAPPAPSAGLFGRRYPRTVAPQSRSVDVDFGATIDSFTSNPPKDSQ